MSDLNLQIVREFFELHRFYVLPHWRCQEWSRNQENVALLFVEQPATAAQTELDFVLRPGDVAGIRRAVVEVRAWHADRFYPSVIENNPVLGRVAAQEVRDLAGSVFGGADFRTVLVVSELSASPPQRDKAAALLREFGLDHVIEFPTILGDILSRISVTGSYAPSQTLQTMRLLKRYGFIRRQQMELLFPLEPPTE